VGIEACTNSPPDRHQVDRALIATVRGFKVLIDKVRLML